MRWKLSIPREMLRELVSIYAQDVIWSTKYVKLGRIQFNKQVGERTIDILADFQGAELFIVVESEKPRPEQIEEYYDFCKKYSPNEAWLVAPKVTPMTKRLPPRVLFENRVITPYLKIIPIREVLEDLLQNYDIGLEVVDEEPRLVLGRRIPGLKLGRRLGTEERV